LFGLWISQQCVPSKHWGSLWTTRRYTHNNLLFGYGFREMGFIFRLTSKPVAVESRSLPRWQRRVRSTTASGDITTCFWRHLTASVVMAIAYRDPRPEEAYALSPLGERTAANSQRVGNNLL
jgi:hypothetical protein